MLNLWHWQSLSLCDVGSPYRSHEHRHLHDWSSSSKSVCTGHKKWLQCVCVCCTCGVVTLKVAVLVGVEGLGEMLFWAWAWARACWGTITSWPISVRTSTIPPTHTTSVIQRRPGHTHTLNIQQCITESINACNKVSKRRFWLIIPLHMSVWCLYAHAFPSK